MNSNRFGRPSTSSLALCGNGAMLSRRFTPLENAACPGALRVLVLLLAAIPAAADDIFDPKSKLKVEAAGGVGGEGPAWHPELGLLCSGNGDVNRLARDGTVSVYRKGAGTNGLLFDPKGRLLACDSDHRRMVRLEPDGTLTVLADKFHGKRFNTPNDLTIDSKGRLYFSDPRYGDRTGMEITDEKGQTVEGVYRIDPDGKVPASSAARWNGPMAS